MAMLKPLGIERGKPFAPNGAQARALADGAEIGQLMAIANSFDKRFPTALRHGPLGSHGQRGPEPAVRVLFAAR